MHSRTDVQLQSTDSRKALESMLTTPESHNQAGGTKRKREENDEDEEVDDEVRLWEDGFKERYYESKFDVGSRNLEFRLVAIV